MFYKYGMGFIINPYIYATSFVNDKSMVFDGVDERVECGGISELDSCTNFSVSFWMKRSTNAEDRVWGCQVSPSNMFACSTKNLTTKQLYFFAENGTTVYGFTTGAAYQDDDTWRHYAFVYDGGGATNADKVKVYVDGSSQAMSFGAGTIASSMASNLSSGVWKIGGRDATAYFEGSIDEFACFDYSLSAAQVTNLYNSGTPTDLDNTSGVTAPVHWWRMGDGSDTISTIYDVGTAGGNNGTPVNMEAGDIQNNTP